MPNACDYSESRPNPVELLAAGIVGAVRYTFDGTMPGKGITQTEYNGLRQAGMQVALVCETGSQPALRGASGGTQDAEQSEAVCNALMWEDEPYNGVIYYVAEDPNMLPQSDWPIVVEYFTAVKAVNPKRLLGAYGSQALVQSLQRLGLVTYGWEVGPWSTDTAGMHLCQQIGNVPAQFAGQIDLDVILQSDWGSVPRPVIPTPPTTLPPKPPDPIYSTGEDGIVSISAGPGGRFDTVVVGTDMAVWHGYAANAPDIMTMGWTSLAGKVYSCSGAWSSDGNWYVVTAHGTDNGLYVNIWNNNTQKWSGWEKQPHAMLHGPFTAT